MSRLEWGWWVWVGFAGYIRGTVKTAKAKAKNIRIIGLK